MRGCLLKFFLQLLNRKRENQLFAFLMHIIQALNFKSLKIEIFSQKF